MRFALRLPFGVRAADFLREAAGVFLADTVAMLL
jgi:hypothetical protein